MAAIIWSDVEGFATDLPTIGVAAQDDILDQVNSQIRADVFGGESSPKLRLARIYMAAHFATLIGRGGAAGPVTMEQAGGLLVQYAVSGASDGFGSTTWGQMFRNLARTTVARGPVLI